ncbi:MAG TPA: PHP domain-containing protein [Candidatus Dormibacteraeota bacterium]|nr:PHP domain-containing protein [Candidatus Dormibacteraeota bacterium]
MFVDLHLHTTCSDGVLSPQQLFEEVRRRELRAFCVSDHDTVEAYPVPHDLAEFIIPGLEVDSQHDGHTVHILAYGIDDPATPLLRSLSEQRLRRHNRMEQMIHRCCELGLDVDIAEVITQARGVKNLGRPHLARVLVAKGYVQSVQEAFDRYLADEASGFVALDRGSSQQTIGWIHRSGGVAIVAHPLRLRRSEHLTELVELGIDGIEVEHPTASPQMRLELENFARERKLLITGGTDFHAPNGRDIGVEFDEEAIERLKRAIERYRLPHLP